MPSTRLFQVPRRRGNGSGPLVDVLGSWDERKGACESDNRQTDGPVDLISSQWHFTLILVEDLQLKKKSFYLWGGGGEITALLERYSCS